MSENETMVKMLEVKHKGVTFSQDSKLPHRFNFVDNGKIINSCDVPGGGITGMEAGKKGIMIQSGDKKYKFVYYDVKNWQLIDITPQQEVRAIRKEGK